MTHHLSETPVNHQVFRQEHGDNHTEADMRGFSTAYSGHKMKLTDCASSHGRGAGALPEAMFSA